jgi:hypothetical protein
LDTQVFYAFLEAQVDIYQTSAISVDDILVHEGRCIFSDGCEFEDELICGYTNDLTADFNWTRGDGSTSLPGTTGPTIDVENVL